MHAQKGNGKSVLLRTNEETERSEVMNEQNLSKIGIRGVFLFRQILSRLARGPWYLVGELIIKSS